MASPASSLRSGSGSRATTPLRGRVRGQDHHQVLEPSSVGPLRKRALLRAFGKNYLADAYSPALRLLCVPDGAEFHLYRFRPDEPPAHTGCVLRPPSLLEDRNASIATTQALHAAWAPDAARPGGLLAVAWPKTLSIYQIHFPENAEETPLAASKLGEIRLERKPSGLAWHPAACVPLLAVHDISEILLVQLPRAADDDAGSSSSAYHPPPPPSPSPAAAPRTPSRNAGGATPVAARRTPSRASVVPRPGAGADAGGATGAAAVPAIKIASFMPSLPGALETVAWSQHGRHLAASMEGVLRTYDWPAPPACNGPLEQLDLAAMPFIDTRLRRRVRAIYSAGPQGFAAAADTELRPLGGETTAASGRRTPGPANIPSSSSSSSSSSLHLIHLAGGDGASASASGGGSTRLVDVETAAVEGVAMPDLLAVMPVGGGSSGGQALLATHALAAVGSHTSATIAVYRLTARQHGGGGPSVAPLFTVQLPAQQRPKGLGFAGSRLVILTGVREGTAAMAAASRSVAEFSVSLAVYSLPPDVFHHNFRPSTPTKYTAALETQRVHPQHQHHQPPPPSPYASPATPLRTARPYATAPSGPGSSQRLFRMSAAASPAPSLGSLLDGASGGGGGGSQRASPFHHLPRHLVAAVGPLGPQPHSQMGTPVPVPVRAFMGTMPGEGPQQQSSLRSAHAMAGSSGASSPFLPGAVGRLTGLGKGKGAPASPTRHLTASPGLTGRLLTDLPALNASSNSNPPSVAGTPRGYGALSPAHSVTSVRGRVGSVTGLGFQTGGRPLSPSTSSAGVYGGTASYWQPQPPPPPPPARQEEPARTATLEQLSAAVAAMSMQQQQQQQQQHRQSPRPVQLSPQEREREEAAAQALAALIAPSYPSSAAPPPPPPPPPSYASSLGAVIAAEEEVPQVPSSSAGGKALPPAGREASTPSPFLPTSTTPLPYHPSASPHTTLPSAALTATAAGPSQWDTTDRSRPSSAASITGSAAAAAAAAATADALFGGSCPSRSYSRLWPIQAPEDNDGGGAEDGLFGGPAPSGGDDPFAAAVAVDGGFGGATGADVSPPPPPLQPQPQLQPPPPSSKGPAFFNPAQYAPPSAAGTAPPPPPTAPLSASASNPYSYRPAGGLHDTSMGPLRTPLAPPPPPPPPTVWRP